MVYAAKRLEGGLVVTVDVSNAIEDRLAPSCNLNGMQISL